jgi:hypothetical protein
LGAGFELATFCAGELGFGGNQKALAGSFKHRGPVSPEVGLQPFQRGKSGIKATELLLYFSNNRISLGGLCNGNLVLAKD